MSRRCRHASAHTNKTTVKITIHLLIKGVKGRPVGLTVVADHGRTGIRVVRAGLGTLPVAVIIIGTHASVTLQSIT